MSVTALATKDCPTCGATFTFPGLASATQSCPLLFTPNHKGCCHIDEDVVTTNPDGSVTLSPSQCSAAVQTKGYR